MIATFENKHLNLGYTLECGQTFRWKKMPDGFYYGVASDTFVRIKQEGSRFSFETAPQPEDYPTLARYFGLDQDQEYLDTLAAIRTDPAINRAIDRYYGLRLLRQPPFETLISFILSANNNIPTVSRTVQAISKNYGTAVLLGKYRGYIFPTPLQLGQASETALNEECGAEYRGKYIIESTQTILREKLDWEGLLTLPYDWAHGQLTRLPGVGRNVADCVMLFSLGKYEAFPLDGWVQQAMQTYYFDGQKTTPREMHRLVAAKWGEQAGYANEFLFMYARNHLKKAAYQKEVKDNVSG